MIKYHINEIIKRITCTEKNKPEIDKEKMETGYDEKSQLYKVLTYQQRKSLIYIWCTVNDEKMLLLKSEDYKLIKNLLLKICITMHDQSDKEVFQDRKRELKNRLKKLPDYRLMIDCICDKYGLNYVKPYLYFRNNKKHREIVNDILNAN